MTQKTSGYSPGRILIRRLGGAALTLLAIAYLTIFVLIMAERGRNGLPAQPLNAAAEALVDTANFVFNHPKEYIYHHENVQALQLVWTIFNRSTGLLLVSLVFATLIGIPLGITMASRRGLGRSLMVVLSILGVSTPSFLLAMLLWILNIAIYRQFNIHPLPPTGFGWDAHMIMPALVLAARPLAQIAQVTHVSLTEAMGQDFIRVAQAKGLTWRMVRDRHALRTCLLPIFTTVGASLRFSLSTLPVVEFFFLWPGVGLTLIEAINGGMTTLITDLILSLGLLFLVVNLVVEFFFPLLDPRVRQNGAQQELDERLTLKQRWANFLTALSDLDQKLENLFKRKKRERLRPLPKPVNQTFLKPEAPFEAWRTGFRWIMRSLFTNPTVLVGSLLVVGFLALVMFGSQLTPASPYQIHGVMMVEGEIGAPPYPPSSIFPWGSDHIGRDIQAIVLAGAKNTLGLAFFGMLARVLLGTILGLLAGWWRGSWFDRTVTAAVGVWAAFPLTLFAMLIIQGIGIQQGTWVFVVAICVVGWGEVAQVVRGQVQSVRPQLYIEAAHVVGAGTGRILIRHVLPQLLSTLLVISVLEMGGVLMLLAELGFLNIFLGGGFRVMIGEAGRMVPVVAHYSDVPEWGAMLSNIRDWWRSYPWMAWYPGAAFFLAIVTFNLWGEGMRRFLDESRLNIARLLNRYVLMAAAAAAVIMVLLLRGTTPMGLYKQAAQQFNAQRTMTDLTVLTAPELAGRETGTPGAQYAANYIASRMEEIGLMPGGSKETYFQIQPAPRFHLMQMPKLSLLDEQGNQVQSYVYRQDFVEWLEVFQTAGQLDGKIMGIVSGPEPEKGEVGYGLGNYELYDKVIVVRKEDAVRIGVTNAAGVLVISDNPLDFFEQFLYNTIAWDPSPPPMMLISRQLADQLLTTTGTSLNELEEEAASLGVGELAMTETGASVHMEVLPSPGTDLKESYYNVIGYIPGIGAEVQAPGGVNLDHYVIMVGANYDGLGTSPDRVVYPGANDNASGVATMLEIARILKESPYPPKRTVVFVAWAGGERKEGLSVINTMGAKRGFDQLDVEAVLELSGVGAGDGRSIELGEGSSYRLVQLFQRVGDRLGVDTTTRGRGPHYGQFYGLGFGQRSALSVYVSWDGSDKLVHTPLDNLASIDLRKIDMVGKTTLMSLFMLSREISGW